MADTFIPKRSSSTTISATTSTGSASLDGSCPQVRLYNKGAVEVFVRWGIGAQTATTADMALAPGAVEVFGTHCNDAQGHPSRADTIAAITSSGSATLYITSGTGN